MAEEINEGPFLPLPCIKIDLMIVNLKLFFYGTIKKILGIIQ